MSVPTMEELVELFDNARSEIPLKAGWHKRDTAGLLAVLDRLKPVLANAHFDGQTHADFNGAVRSEPSDDYATRIIDQIKGA